MHVYGACGSYHFLVSIFLILALILSVPLLYRSVHIRGSKIYDTHVC